MSDVVNITNDNKISHHPYFYNKIDNSKGYLIGKQIEGQRNYHFIDAKTNESTQVTHFKENINDFSANFINDQEFVFDNGEDIIYKMNIYTGKIETIYETTDSKYTLGGPPQINKEGTKIILCLHLKEDAFITNVSNTWDNFLKQSKMGMRTQVVIYDIENKTSEILIDTSGEKMNGWWLNHPQFSKTSEEYVSFCHEGAGGTIADRIWVMNLTTKEIFSPVTQSHDKEIISHEFFFNKSNKIGYVKIDSDESNEGTLWYYDISTDENKLIASLPRCSHFISSSDDEFIIADEAIADAKLQDSDFDEQTDLGLYLVEVKTGKYKKIANHNSKMKSYGNSQDAHAHPVFVDNDSAIIFTSDYSGVPQVYKVELTKQMLEF